MTCECMGAQTDMPTYEMRGCTNAKRSAPCASESMNATLRLSQRMCRFAVNRLEDTRYKWRDEYVSAEMQQVCAMRKRKHECTHIMSMHGRANRHALRKAHTANTSTQHHVTFQRNAQSDKHAQKRVHANMMFQRNAQIDKQTSRMSQRNAHKCVNFDASCTNTKKCCRRRRTPPAF